MISGVLSSAHSMGPRVRYTSLSTSSTASGNGSELSSLRKYRHLFACLLCGLLLFIFYEVTHAINQKHYVLGVLTQLGERTRETSSLSNCTLESYAARNIGSSCTPGSQRTLPNAIIIGAKKAGTRALLEFLNFHCDIRVAHDEIHFFDEDETYQKGVEWYISQMPCFCPGQITIEKSPAYFNTPEVPSRLKKMNESIKLILIVKDPVKRLISDYVQISTKKESRGKQMESFQALTLNKNGSINSEFIMIQKSIYASFIEHWLSVFPRNQLLILDGDQLIKDPPAELRKVEEFLHISHQLDREKFYFNKDKGFYCHKENYSNCVAKSPLDSDIDGVKRNGCLKDDKGREHPDIEPDLLKKLQDFFHPHNQRFFQLIGQRFNWDEED